MHFDMLAEMLLLQNGHVCFSDITFACFTPQGGAYEMARRSDYSVLALSLSFG